MYKNRGISTTRLYRIWINMRQRCNNPNCEAYKNYGGRGITICEAWENSFTAFEDWAYSNGYREYLTIDRIDNSKGYSPDNCRWATSYQQNNNRRPAVRTSRYNPYAYREKPQYEIEGVFHSSAEWAGIAGITQKLFLKRWGKGKRGTDLIKPNQRKEQSGTAG